MEFFKYDFILKIDGEIVQEEYGGDFSNELEMSYEFNEDETVYLYLKQLTNGEVFEGLGTYSINGDIITFQFSGGVLVYEFDVINDELKLTSKEDVSYDGKQYNIEMVYYFKQ